MTVTLDQLEAIAGELQESPSPTNQILLELVAVEIKRRSASGRKKVDKTLLERNAEASRKYREKKRMTELFKLAEKERRAKEKDKRELMELGIYVPPIPKPNKQRWHKKKKRRYHPFPNATSRPLETRGHPKRKIKP